MRVNLHAERVNRGLTLDDAAEGMSVDKAVLWRAERGDSRPNARNAFKIASFYDRKVTDVWPLDPVEDVA